ncbi:SDR family oxidoreductase [Ectothiorhodospira lacustris]|uniref:SDR family oxidoreductase n=1 Tax=Ectothiorhodospira lacustris TaxID=2899127 RepID=UPI001EE895C9|nr:SDR family oxidoreductase [Ectothiorhodospira lacustris]MCG5500748.1 SDR family oxidoreductase [Ectothiorhodospira lacustris]MCG5510884.1 SDR family oxidoreductase [Ectothiorhodospira lacustris]MCG5522570.1 SDR family oxidoreductase [Ectothiorhodospira lacustris]
MTETVVITGANRGIGLAFAQQYAEAGARVLAACRHPEQARELNRLAAKTRGRVSVHPLDVTNPVQIQALAGILSDTPVDILINNAGSYGPASAFGNTDVAGWMETLHINTVAPLKIMEALVDPVAAGNRRLMINLSSKMGSMGDNGSGGSYIYRSTKAALNAVVVSAARDLKARGITVVAQHPGWVRTDMGGPNGEIDTTRSVTAMRGIFEHLSLADSGRFIDIDGSDIPW